MKTKIIRTSSGLRKVKILRNGQYRFMKMTKRKKRTYHAVKRRTRKITRHYRKARKKTYKSRGTGLYG